MEINKDTNLDEKEICEETTKECNCSENSSEDCSQDVKNEPDDVKQEVNEDKDELKELKEKNETLSNDLKSSQDKYLRTVAEYDNFRKRTIKEKEGIYTDACIDVLKEMFPVLDNLERAIGSEGDIETLKKGIDMTIRQFKDALLKLNVEEIENEGEFDPNLHNAVMHVEDENYGANAIVEVFQKGYKRQNKVLRYSMVKVAN
jgi:molecular chaperone GrpE